MRLFLLLFLVVCFTTPSGAQEQRDPWRWSLTEAVRGHWETRQGVADVEISGHDLHIRLRDSEKDVEDRFDIAGTIDIDELGKERRGIQNGTIRAIVTRLASDIRPSEYVGTYWKAVLTPRLRESFGIEYTEIIVLSDPVSTVSLLRETKAKVLPDPRAN